MLIDLLLIRIDFIDQPPSLNRSIDSLLIPLMVLICQALISTILGGRSHIT